NAPTSLSNFQANTSSLTNSLLQSVATSTLNVGNLREEQKNTVFFTDDQAPVEQLINSIILDTITGANNP
ncbi:MAG TPA: spermine synthase, partial [Ktedonobacteraceae bacterium]|nr:spermine synthase [Ktedonobacteraceae bacterium]